MSPAHVTISSRGVERIFSGHPWIYRSDISVPAEIEPGAIVSVQDRRKRFLGQALYSSKSQIALRFLTREKTPFDRTFLAQRIQAATAYRRQVVQDSEAYRVVASEGDLLPSLIIDRYGEYFVIQTLSQGMEKLKPLVTEILQEQFSPRGILERNDVAVRSLEGLEQTKGVLAGDVADEVVVGMNGLQFAFDLLQGQKTGGFLDQRENQKAAQSYAYGRALDCFTYAGGFAVTLSTRCDTVLGIDSSEEALRMAQRNAELNNVSNLEWKQANCFDFLKAADQSGDRFDTVVLDPPAFARQRSNLDSALRGYKELNLRAMKILNPGGYLITCSCSYHVTESDFLSAIASAAVDVHRTVTVVERRTQGRDHPILLTVPETHYLKCLILRVL
ncbi:MAG: class I SAM-dependent rRNA methyltransferase [Acidobacteriota bacterium]